MVKFYEFLQTGVLNGIGLGNTAFHVRRTLGNPTDVAYENHKPSILKYNDLQFLFFFNEKNKRSEVHSIYFEFFLSKHLSFPSILLPDDWFPNSLSTDNQFHKYIVKHGLHWNTYLDFGNEVHYIVEDKAHICFRKTRKSYRLSTLSVSAYHYAVKELTDSKNLSE